MNFKIMRFLKNYIEKFVEIGNKFKESDNAAYARGLIKEQIFKMVKFWKEGGGINGIVNYFQLIQVGLRNNVLKFLYTNISFLVFNKLDVSNLFLNFNMFSL
jgi:hypothetical protein